MFESWIVWVVGSAMFAAGVGTGVLVVFRTGTRQVKDILEYAATMAGQANVAQELKDKRTAAYYESKRRGQAPTSREDKRARDRADQMVNGHDEH